MSGTHIHLALQGLLAPFYSLFMSLASGEFPFFLFNLAINLKLFHSILFRTPVCLEQEGVQVSSDCYAAGSLNHLFMTGCLSTIPLPLTSASTIPEPDSLGSNSRPTTYQMWTWEKVTNLFSHLYSEDSQNTDLLGLLERLNKLDLVKILEWCLGLLRAL